MIDFSLLQQAANSVLTKTLPQPSPSSIVETLLEAEKTAKKNKPQYSFDRLIGTWRLCFITGTKKTREKAGIVLGSGKYIPSFVKITISYSTRIISAREERQASIATGTVENCVSFGALKLSLTGPVKFLTGQNILAFDFTRINVELFGAKLYRGYIRGGEAKDRSFDTEKIGKQAFFAYFLIEEDIIAARGRGGGLALWGRERNS
jgi:hypothetical protein